jgi:hypothetical protein
MSVEMNYGVSRDLHVARECIKKCEPKDQDTS